MAKKNSSPKKKKPCDMTMAEYEAWVHNAPSGTLKNFPPPEGVWDPDVDLQRKKFIFGKNEFKRVVERISEDQLKPDLIIPTSRLGRNEVGRSRNIIVKVPKVKSFFDKISEEWVHAKRGRKVLAGSQKSGKEKNAFRRDINSQYIKLAKK